MQNRRQIKYVLYANDISIQTDPGSTMACQVNLTDLKACSKQNHRTLNTAYIVTPDLYVCGLLKMKPDLQQYVLCTSHASEKVFHGYICLIKKPMNFLIIT